MQAETQKIIDQLNTLLAGELTAIDQYFLHSEMYKNWGFERLWVRIHHEMEDEREHARILVARILFLEGTPDLVTRMPLNTGSDVLSLLKADLETEYQVGKALKQVIKTCEEARDYVTRDILKQMLVDTEQDHTHWLEQQLQLIAQMGIQNYLQAQMASES